jgi:hypothetical protein
MPEEGKPIVGEPHCGFIGPNGIQYEPIGREVELTEDISNTRHGSNSASRMLHPWTYTVYSMQVSKKELRWLRRQLGMPRLEQVWEYRKWRKGHPRCDM